VQRWSGQRSRGQFRAEVAVQDLEPLQVGTMAAPQPLSRPAQPLLRRAQLADIPEPEQAPARACKTPFSASTACAHVHVQQLHSDQIQNSGQAEVSVQAEVHPTILPFNVLRGAGQHLVARASRLGCGRIDGASL
jgi:hypothetical protein